MNCKKNITCPKGGMSCCLGCPHKKCAEKCSKKFHCWLESWIPGIKWGMAIYIVLVLIIIMFRLHDLEQEHNAIIDRIDQVENNITQYVDKKFPAEEFTDTEENLGGEFKSWMSFQTNLG